VLRVTVPGDPECQRFDAVIFEPAEDDAILASMFPMNAPAADDRPDTDVVDQGALEPRTILRPDRLLGPFQFGRVGRTEGEQVEDGQPSAAPLPGKADTPADGGIVVRGVRG
jgi:hypothetical protein